HSLGEIAALHWAGAMSEETLLRVARTRGQTMSAHSASGTMASIGAAPEAVRRVIADRPVVIAGYNGPTQTVIAGSVDAVEQVCAKAVEAGLQATRLAVSHAFHSPLVAPAADAFAAALAAEDFGAVHRRIISTVTGEQLEQDTDVVGLLHRQITDPVLFTQALTQVADEVDLLVEVGPGRVLSGLAETVTTVPAVALDTDDESIANLLRVVAAAYLVGAASIDPALFHGRLVRPLRVGTEFKFFASPCEQVAPVPAGIQAVAASPASATPVTAVPLNPPSVSPQPVSPHSAGSTAVTLPPVSLPSVSVPSVTTVPVVAASPAPAQPGSAGAAGQEPSAESSLDLLRRLAAERAELPLELVHSDSRLLDDLHLSSITVGQVTNQVAQRLGVAAAQVPTNFATATLRELAEALDALAQTSPEQESAPTTVVAGAAAWARAWSVDLDPLPMPARLPAEADGQWRVYADSEHPLAEPLRRALEHAHVGGGVLVCLPAECSEARLQLALQGAKAAIAAGDGTRFVLVQHGRGAAGLAKTLRLEAPHLRISIVHVPVVAPDGDRATGSAHPAPAEVVGWVVDEVAATVDYVEVYYDEAGVRRIPTLRALPIRPAREQAPLDDTDVLLVTGGGKGITAECAMAIARETGAKLALLGRSDPASDADLRANLARMEQSGLIVRYASADVTDAAQVRRAVDGLTEILGPVTAVLHGAGRNDPAALTNLDMAAFRQTFAPKLDGLRAVLAAIDPGQLRLLVTLGSIIGRAGLRGEAHYATANEWLADLTREIGERHPGCRAICLEWSVWSGVGMGERLSVVETLAREGVTPITPDQGVAILRRLLVDPQAPAVVVISGRTQGIDTVRYDLPDLPLLRFIERPLIRYHGVELVAEVELNAGTDLYLADHLLDGNLLFPAVFGMEAMAQVANAVTGRGTVPVIEAAEFLRPIVVPPGGSTVIRVAGVVTDDDVVDVVIQSEETSFAAEHFRARLRLSGIDAPDGPPEQVPAGLPPVPLEPAGDLYGDTLFQG
ncbi:MAG TPA: SDR family NAD(P)-dependent oxidoreductase, partial [Micromonosporaceae bacterium]